MTIELQRPTGDSLLQSRALLGQSSRPFSALSARKGSRLTFERNREFPDAAPDFSCVHRGKTQLQSFLTVEAFSRIARPDHTHHAFLGPSQPTPH